MKNYVTYLPNGALDGYFIQEPPEEHLDRMLEVGPEFAATWCNFRANDTRDGLEPIPTAEPSQQPRPVPQSVTMRQARLALLNIGKLDAVESAINSMQSPDKDIARIEWDYSSAVDRHRPLVMLLGGALGLNEKQLDDLFLLAETL